ncbi:MAG: hypothetical protein LBQ69_04870 [Treponema sp.]|jgi:hypothetical protein|nr:hypothetical protein [Treponema sp.]
MAKVTDNERILFNSKIVPFREAIEAILKEEKEAYALLKGKGPDSAIKRLEIAEAMLNLASNYMVINGVSLSVQNQKSEEALNDARKALYKSVIYIEEAVSNFVDAPYSEYEKRLDEIEAVSPAQRFFLVRKMGLAIELLEHAYGDNSKWKWGFVEIEGRYAVVTKNLINLRDVMINTDPRSPHYEPVTFHLSLARKLLLDAANRYREKYELSTNNIDDFKKGISFLSALRLLNFLTGDQAEATIAQKKLKIWTNKLTSDMERMKMMASRKG